MISSEFNKHLEDTLNTIITSVTSLGRGAHNTNLLLHTPEKKYVLRIYENTQFDNCEQEAQMLEFLDGRFAPKVYLVDVSKKHHQHNFMVQEFITGDKPKEFDEAFIKELANTLKRLHAITNTPDSQEDFIDEWTQTHIKNTSAVLKEQDRTDVLALYEHTKAELESMRPILDQYPRTNVIHNDLILDNTIIREGEMVLIDWEFARFDAFFVDLGVFIQENHLSNAHTQLFLNTYGFGETPDEAKVVTLSVALRSLSHIAWYIERISHIQQGILDEDQESHVAQLRSHLEYINKILTAP